MENTTKELLNKIKKCTDITKCVEENREAYLNITPVQYLNNLIEVKKLIIADIAEGSERGDYVYKVFSGKRKASRDVLIAIAFGMNLTLDETQLLLRIASKARLDPKNARDSVIIYGLYSSLRISHVNDILYERSERLL